VIDTCEHCNAPNPERGFYRISGNDVTACRPCMEQWGIRHEDERDCLYCQESVHHGSNAAATSLGAGRD